MAVQYVRDSGEQLGSNVASDAYTWGTNPAVGNHVIAAIAMWQPSVEMTGIAVTDNQGGSNTYSPNVNLEAYAADHDWVNISSCKLAASSGTFTVTIDETGAVVGNFYAHWGLVEFSGVSTSNWADQTGSFGDAPASATSTGVTATGENTTTAGVAVAIAGLNLADSDLNVGAPSAPYATVYIEDNGNVIGGGISYSIYSATETSSATWTHDAVATNYGRTAAIATYKAEGPAGITRTPDAGSLAAAGLGDTLGLGIAGNLGAATFAGLAGTALRHQYARPASDVADGTWTPSTGTDLYATLDEGVADDADYDRSGVDPDADTAVIGLSSLIPPGAGTVTLRVRARRTPT